MTSRAPAIYPHSPAIHLYTAQLNISFVPDIWGQNIRAVESLDAHTEQAQISSSKPRISRRARNVVTAAIQEASLRGQIAATEPS